MCQRLLPAFMLLLFVLPLSAFASPPLLETEWTFDPGESAVGCPVPMTRGEAANAVVVTLGYYRLKPWVAFQLGMNGGGYWVYSGEDWWFPDPLRSEYGTVYLTDRGAVTTERWEASRVGIEDYELLRMVREAAQRAASPKGQAALKLLDEAVRFVTRGQEEVTDITRQIWPYTPDF